MLQHAMVNQTLPSLADAHWGGLWRPQARAHQAFWPSFDDQPHQGLCSCNSMTRHLWGLTAPSTTPISHGTSPFKPTTALCASGETRIQRSGQLVTDGDRTRVHMSDPHSLDTLLTHLHSWFRPLPPPIHRRLGLLGRGELLNESFSFAISPFAGKNSLDSIKRTPPRICQCRPSPVQSRGAGC